MIQNDKLDQIYRKALSSQAKPDPALNNTIIKKMEERIQMNKPIRTIMRPTIAIVMAVAITSITAFAAWNFLSPADVATQLSSPVLAEAFRSKDAVLINEVQSDSGYDVNFLGIVSGENLTDINQEINTAKTYAVVAIKKQSGETMSYTEDFFVSPLIKGQKPWLFNIASMNGGYSSIIVDATLYRMIECDSIEMFADRGLSLIVSSTAFYNMEAFNYNDITGLVTSNPDFDGVNLVFNLPIDEDKSNHSAAQAYLDGLWNAPNESENQSVVGSDETELSDEIAIDNNGITIPPDGNFDVTETNGEIIIKE